MNDCSLRKGREKLNLPSSLKKTAETNADKTAYIFMHQPVTYKELDTAVSKFADGLKKLGLKKGDHMALLLGNSPQFIIALYGAMRRRDHDTGQPDLHAGGNPLHIG